MRFTLLIVLLYFLCTAEKCTPRVGPNLKFDEDSCMVTVHVTVTTPYCGGARPTDEILEDSRKPKPLARQLFHIKQGSENSLNIKELRQMVTDTAGKLALKLLPGKYMLLFPEHMIAMDTSKYSDNRNYKYDRKCLLEWWKKPALLLDVKKNADNNFQVHFVRKCFVSGWWTCEVYTGPPPPATRTEK